MMLYTATAFRQGATNVISSGSIISRRSAAAASSAAFVSLQNRHQQQGASKHKYTSFAPRSISFRHSQTTSKLFSTLTKEETTTIKDTQYDQTNISNGLANTSYEPSTFENEIYTWWETSG